MSVRRARSWLIRFLLSFTLRRLNKLKFTILYPKPITKSREAVSTSWQALILRFRIRLVLYSTLAVSPFLRVASIPMRGENCSLMDTMLISKRDEGMGFPVCTSSTKPRSPI